MEKFAFNRSMKDIPIPSEDQYRKQLLYQTERFIQRIRWIAYFFLNPDNTPADKETFEFKTTKTAPQVQELIIFEQQLADLVSTGIKFRKWRNPYQRDLDKAVKEIKESTQYFLDADKTSNCYKVSGDFYKQTLLDNITRDYCQTTRETVDKINNEARDIAKELKLGDRIEIYSENTAFVTLKDHKEHFERDRPCRLINPAKNEIGKISKQLLQKINKELRETTGLTQWQSTKAALDWFKNIPNKKQKRFMQFDIDSFYPSISKELLKKSLDWASSQLATPITEQTKKIIYHSRKSLLFTKDPHSKVNIPWRKKDGLFDVTMGAPDGAEICELVGLFLLTQVKLDIPEVKFGLYRDDGLGYHSARLPRGRMEQIRKQLHALFKRYGLTITIEKPDLTSVNFLDVTLDLEKGIFKPYKKPNDQPLYVHKLSNHPPCVTRAIPKSINKRLSSISSTAKEFDQAKGEYQAALKHSGYNYNLEFEEPRPKQKKKDHRNIIFFNPPWNQAVKTNVGAKFLELVRDSFPKGHPLRPILNRNTVKVSYCCMKNMAQIKKAQNSKIINKQNNQEQRGGCNCQAGKKDKCPIKDNCNQKNVVYHAQVLQGEEKNYVGSTVDFKQRWYKHVASFRNENLQNSTTLSSHIWNAGLDPEPRIKWSILARAEPYVNGGRACDLCLTEKLHLAKIFNNPQYLNLRSELALRCRHRRKYLLAPDGDDG